MLNVSLVTRNPDQERGFKQCPSCRKQVASNELANFIYCEQGVIRAGIYQIEKYPYKISESEDQWYSNEHVHYIDGAIKLIKPTHLSSTWSKIMSFWGISTPKEGQLCRECAKKYGSI